MALDLCYLSDMSLRSARALPTAHAASLTRPAARAATASTAAIRHSSHLHKPHTSRLWPPAARTRRLHGAPMRRSIGALFSSSQINTRLDTIGHMHDASCCHSGNTLDASAKAQRDTDHPTGTFVASLACLCSDLAQQQQQHLKRNPLPANGMHAQSYR